MKKKLTAALCVVCLLLGLAVPVLAASVLGDADGDGKLSPEDARIVLRVSVKLDDPGAYADLMDVDGDGKITAEDARLVLRRCVGLESSFPAEERFAPPLEDVNLNVSVAAPRALLYDVAGNRLLFRKNIDEKTAPASLIKLLTALTALAYCAPSQVCTVGDEIDLIAEDSSVCPLEKGWRLTLEQLLHGMLLPSGNDAAYCTAANVARIVTGAPAPAMAVSYFTIMMNQTAKELGMTDTYVTTPDGYDAPGQYTTARDLLTLARAALQNDVIVGVCAKNSVSYTMNDGTAVTWKSTNRYLNPTDKYYDSRVFGLKGGFTDDAGCCLIAACAQNGRKYIAIIMGTDTFEARYDCATTLMNAAALYQAGILK